MYEAEIRYLDEQLNRLWEYLCADGLWDETLLIVTSDHGKYIGEEGLVFHHHNRLSDPLVHVPLFVKYPEDRYAGTTVSRPVDLTQIDDTIKNVVCDGVEPAWGREPLHPDITPSIVKSEYVKRPKRVARDVSRQTQRDHCSRPECSVRREAVPRVRGRTSLRDGRLCRRWAGLGTNPSRYRCHSDSSARVD